MSRKFKFRNQHQPYFITCSVVRWLKVFNDGSNCNILLGSLKYCQTHKGLIIYGWCFMPDHIHLIIGTRKNLMQDIMRDFKSFTSRHIRKNMIKSRENNEIEKMIRIMQNEGLKNSNNKDWQFWQQNNQPKELFSHTVANQKLNYIHFNPVKAGLAENPTERPYSSARDYEGKKGLIEIEILR